MIQPDTVRALYESMYRTVGTPANADLDKEMTPILIEQCTLGPGKHEHPAVKQLSNWLFQPRRTVEEFNYVIRPLYRWIWSIL